MNHERAHPLPISDLKCHLGFWMRFVSNHVSHRFASRLEESGVTVAEWVILRELYAVESTAPSALASVTGLTRGAVSKLVERLCAKKMVTRTEATGDRRFQEVALTAAAKKLVPKLAAIADENDALFFGSLTKAEREQLLATLKKLVKVNQLSQFPLD